MNYVKLSNPPTKEELKLAENMILMIRIDNLIWKSSRERLKNIMKLDPHIEYKMKSEFHRIMELKKIQENSLYAI